MFDVLVWYVYFGFLFVFTLTRVFVNSDVLVVLLLLLLLILCLAFFWDLFYAELTYTCGNCWLLLNFDFDVFGTLCL